MVGAWDTFIIAKVGNYFNYIGRGRLSRIIQVRGAEEGKECDMQRSPNDMTGQRRQGQRREGAGSN